MRKIYFVGGSPCAGKSTVCEDISKKYDLYYFKVDDFLDKYMKKAALNDKPLCKKNLSMTFEEIWMRDPVTQKDEELGIYKEIFEYVIHDLENISCDKDILTEGCAYLPTLIKKLGVQNTSYLAIIPTKDFQILHYQKRPYVSSMLEGCLNKKEAFGNWMERDFLFSKEIERECKNENFKVIINDGKTNIDEIIMEVVNHFDIS